jgi:ankyrin repeat protein
VQSCKAEGEGDFLVRDDSFLVAALGLVMQGADKGGFAAARMDPEKGMEDKPPLVVKGIEQTIVNSLSLETKQNMFKLARDKDAGHQAAAVKKMAATLMSLSVENSQKLLQERDERGNTAFHYAVKAGNMNICKLFYGHGANINARGQNKMKPLQFAARYGDENRVEDVWSCMDWIMTIEQKGGERGVKGMRKKLRKSKETEENFVSQETDKYDFSLLHHAIQNTNWEENPFVASKLIESKKFRITDKDKQGNTCIHLAAQFDKQENHHILDIFLEREFTEYDQKGKPTTKSLDISDEDLRTCIKQTNLLGKTPLHIACSVGNHESVEQILQKGRELGVTDEELKMIVNNNDIDASHPLHLAIESGNLQMMDILLKEGADVTEEAIHCAARLVFLNYAHLFASTRTGNVDFIKKLKPPKNKRKVVTIWLEVESKHLIFNHEIIQGPRVFYFLSLGTLLCALTAGCHTHTDDNTKYISTRDSLGAL